MDKDSKLLNDFLRGKRSEEMITAIYDDREEFLIPESIEGEGREIIKEKSKLFRLVSIRHLSSERLRIPVRSINETISNWGKVDTGKSSEMKTLEPAQTYTYIEDFEFLVPIEKNKFADPDCDLTPDIIKGMGCAGLILDQEFLRGEGHPKGEMEGLTTLPAKETCTAILPLKEFAEMITEIDPRFMVNAACVMDKKTSDAIVETHADDDIGYTIKDGAVESVRSFHTVVIDPDVFSMLGPVREYFGLDFEELFRLRNAAESNIRNHFIRRAPPDGLFVIGDFMSAYRLLVSVGASLAILPTEDERFTFVKVRMRFGGGVIRKDAIRAARVCF